MFSKDLQRKSCNSVTGGSQSCGSSFPWLLQCQSGYEMVLTAASSKGSPWLCTHYWAGAVEVACQAAWPGREHPLPPPKKVLATGHQHSFATSWHWGQCWDSFLLGCCDSMVLYNCNLLWKEQYLIYAVAKAEDKNQQAGRGQKADMEDFILI